MAGSVANLGFLKATPHSISLILLALVNGSSDHLVFEMIVYGRDMRSLTSEPAMRWAGGGIDLKKPTVLVNAPTAIVIAGITI